MSASWTRNGFRYWAIRTADAELVASIPYEPPPARSRTQAAIEEQRLPWWPPSHAKIEAYSVRKGIAKFLGYLEGNQADRAMVCFRQAFSR